MSEDRSSREQLALRNWSFSPSSAALASIAGTIRPPKATQTPTAACRLTLPCRHYGPRWTPYVAQEAGRPCPTLNAISVASSRYWSTPNRAGMSGRRAGILGSPALCSTSGGEPLSVTARQGWSIGARSRDPIRRRWFRPKKRGLDCRCREEIDDFTQVYVAQWLRAPQPKTARIAFAARACGQRTGPNRRHATGPGAAHH